MTSEFTLDDIVIRNTRSEDGQGVYDTVRLAYGMTLHEECDVCISPQAVTEQLARFPKGQFVAVFSPEDEDLVAGMASTMRLSDPPKLPLPAWMDEIGTMGIANHVPDGEWLYGVEMAVRPNFRRRGIGTALYLARFELVKQLKLRGWYAGGMLMGYHRYRDQMSVREYGEKVVRRELVDPTVTMQMNRGFEAWGVCEDYLDEPEAGNAAVLIVWKNPEYQGAS